MMGFELERQGMGWESMCPEYAYSRPDPAHRQRLQRPHDVGEKTSLGGETMGGGGTGTRAAVSPGLEMENGT